MKKDQLILNPETLEEFRLRQQPAKITISKIGITFNQPVVALLALTIGNTFELEIIDKMVFYRESSKGFRVDKELKNSLTANASQINKAVNQYAYGEDKSTTLRYFIGEFKEGRRQLLPID